MPTEKRPDGFPGQRLLVVPRAIARRAQGTDFLRELYPTDVGWFPRSRGHYRERPKGCPQAILIYCLSGKGCCRLQAGDEYRVEEDEALFIPPNVPHAYWSDEESPWTIHWVHFQGRQAARWGGEALEVVKVDAAKRASICSLFEELEWTLETGFSLSSLERGAGVLHHLLSLLRFPSPGALDRGQAAGDRIDEVLRFMEANLELRAGLGELAGRARYSVSHFVSLFGRRAGASPLEHWKQLRVREACRLLDEGRWTVAEIASKLGFEDPLYFSRLFRQSMGESPRAYARREKG
jgi:AraC family transcriptional regulator, arabinose operon regulatory protein